VLVRVRSSLRWPPPFLPFGAVMAPLNAAVKEGNEDRAREERVRDDDDDDDDDDDIISGASHGRRSGFARRLEMKVRLSMPNTPHSYFSRAPPLPPRACAACCAALFMSSAGMRPLHAPRLMASASGGRAPTTELSAACSVAFGCRVFVSSSKIRYHAFVCSSVRLLLLLLLLVVVVVLLLPDRCRLPPRRRAALTRFGCCDTRSSAKTCAMVILYLLPWNSA
jgi:hypothetical protein